MLVEKKDNPFFEIEEELGMEEQHVKVKDLNMIKLSPLFDIITMFYKNVYSEQKSKHNNESTLHPSHQL